jgi:hypothetical protein
VETALKNPATQTFDFLPVTAEDQIVGLFDRATYATEVSGDDGRLIFDLMDPISDRNLISSETSLLTFIAEAREARCRLVLRGTRIDGIVTISDLQKLPVRPALFLLITYVELLLADVLRAADHTDEDRWFNALSDCRKKKLEEEWIKLQGADMNVDKLTASQFCDKREAIVKLFDLPVSNSRARDELKRIEELRNHVAHAGDYAATRNAALKTIDTVALAETWINRLESVLADFEDKRKVA